MHPRARRTRWSGSPSPARGRATTAGSASCPVGWASSTATADRCRPSATWAASCRWQRERPARSRLGPPQDPTNQDQQDETHHWWRLIAIWVVLSAILDPLFYFLAGPHIPPGTMTDTAQGAQFDFNVLFVIALPVLLAVWIYLIYAIIMWRASRGRPRTGRRGGGPGPPRDPGRLDPRHDGHRAVPGRLRDLRAGPARRRGRRRGLEPDLDPDVEDRAADSGHRPAVEVHLPLPDVRRFRDQPAGRPGRHHDPVQRHVARRDPQLLGLPARGQGRRQPGLQQRGLHDDAAARLLHRPLRRALRNLARGDVQQRCAW